MTKSEIVKRCSSAFLRDRQGAVAVVFAFTIGLLVLGVGVGVDMARGVNANTHLQSAADAAVLAAARNAKGTQAELETMANAVFEANKPDNLGFAVSSTSLTLNGGQVTFNVSATMPTTFAAISGTTELSLSTSSSAYRKTDGTEIVIALDTTGSMGFGSSWADAKAAMAEMLTSLDGLAQANDDFYTTLIPFADRVNIGQTKAEAWLDSSITSPPPGHWGNKNPGAGNTNKWCLEPRDEVIDGNPNALTDKSPSTLGFLPSAKDYWVSDLANYTKLTCPNQVVIGPTTNISGFTSAIEGIGLSGTGRFDLGMAWAFRLLSPNWQGEWGVPGYPSAYGERRKIAVFISDAYTEAYRHEVPNRTDGSDNSVNGYNLGSTLGFENFVNVCTQMKAAGIEVHTIYVNGNGHGVPFMKQCATDEASHYHAVSDISGLQDALSQIATSVVQVGITQ